MRPAMTEDELMHFGIKGMRWGVRRFQNPDGTRTQAGKKRYHDMPRFMTKKKRAKLEAKTISDAKDRIHNMSDEELNKKIDRMKRERELETLMGIRKETVDNGRAKTMGALRESGNKVLKDATYKAGMQVVEKFLNKKNPAYKLKQAADKLKYRQDKHNYEKARYDFERSKSRESFEDDKARLKYNQDRLKYFRDLDDFVNGNNSGGGGKKKKKKK